MAIGINFAFDDLSIDNQFIRLDRGIGREKHSSYSKEGQLATLGIADGVGNSVVVIKRVGCSIICISKDSIFIRDCGANSMREFYSTFERGGLQKHRLPFFGDHLACAKFESE